MPIARLHRRSVTQKLARRDHPASNLKTANATGDRSKTPEIAMCKRRWFLFSRCFPCSSHARYLCSGEAKCLFFHHHSLCFNCLIRRITAAQCLRTPHPERSPMPRTLRGSRISHGRFVSRIHPAVINARLTPVPTAAPIALNGREAIKTRGMKMMPSKNSEAVTLCRGW